MCGRFVLYTTGDALLDAVSALPGVTEVHAPQSTPPERYNIAPTQTIPIVREGKRVDPARWGLLPSWKKDDSGPPLFNARAETVAEKPSFRAAFKNKRAVIPMDGYYEWKVVDGGKQPYFVSLGEVMWAAALWETGCDQLSATMITTAATPALEWLHHRTPKFLDAQEVPRWLAGEALLEPTAEDYIKRLAARPVAKEVGNVRNDHAGLIEAVPTMDAE